MAVFILVFSKLHSLLNSQTLCTGHQELQGIVETLTREVEGQSNLLVRLLQLRDKRDAKLEKQCHRMTAILKDYATKNGEHDKVSQLVNERGK